jgi:hypothetical protein
MPEMMVWPVSWIGGDAEGRVFLGETLQADRETLSWSALELRLDGHRDHGLGEGGLLELITGPRRHRVSPVAMSFEADDRRTMSPA